MGPTINQTYKYFDTTSFLALLETKSYRKKLKVQNSEEKFAHIAVKKMFENISNSGLWTSSPSAKLKKLRWPVKIVKLRKGTKIFKNFKNGKFQQNLAKTRDIIILRTSFQCLKRLSNIPISKLKQFRWPIKIHTLGT